MKKQKLLKITAFFLIQAILLPDCVWCAQSCVLSPQINMNQPSFQQGFEFMQLEKNIKRVANPQEKLYQWAINRNVSQIEQAWTHRKIAGQAGISKSAVTKHLAIVEARLLEEKRPLIKKELINAKEALYQWAISRTEAQIDKYWTQKEIAETLGISESSVSNHFSGLTKRLKKGKKPAIKMKLTPEERLYNWAIGRNLKQINKLWSQRELGKRVGIGENLMPRCLSFVQERLRKENKPLIKTGLTDAYKQLYAWAAERTKKQIEKRWGRRELAEQAGISESSVANHLEAVQRRLKEKAQPGILLKLSLPEKLYLWAIKRKGKPKHKTAWTQQEIAKGAGIGEQALKKYLPQLQERLKKERRALIKLFETTYNPADKIYQWAAGRTKKQIDKTWTHKEIAAKAGVGRASVSNYMLSVQRRLKEQEKPLIKLKLNPAARLYLWAINARLEGLDEYWTVEEIVAFTGISERSVLKNLFEINKYLKTIGKEPVKTELDDKIMVITGVEKEIDAMLGDLKAEILSLKIRINNINNEINVINNDAGKKILRKFYREIFSELLDALKFLNEINGIRELFPKFKLYAKTIKAIGQAIDIERNQFSLMSERLEKVLNIIEVYEKIKAKETIPFELVHLLSETLLSDQKYSALGDLIANKEFICHLDYFVSGEKKIPMKFASSLQDGLGISVFGIHKAKIILDGQQTECIVKIASDPERFERNESKARLLEYQAKILKKLEVANMLGYGKIMPFGMEVIFFREFPEGMTLDDLVEQDAEKNILTDKIKHIDKLIQAAKEIQKMHDAGVLHRDIKPQNIWVAKNGQVIVHDFDFSAFMTYAWEKDPLDIKKLGTRGYYPPWLLASLGVIPGVTSDIYALAQTFRSITLFNFDPYIKAGLSEHIVFSQNIRRQITDKASQEEYKAVNDMIVDLQYYKDSLKKLSGMLKRGRRFPEVKTVKILNVTKISPPKLIEQAI